jgi:hypothetical protein
VDWHTQKKFYQKDSKAMVLAHSKEGLPIELDESTSEISYKDTKVSFYVLKDAFESGLDRVQITDSLDMTIKNNFVTFGCLTLTENQVKQLIKLSWKQLKMYNKVGN